MNYTKLNTIVGWVVFAIALLTYLLTVAPTASFWDCSEFIACSYELQVTHPPGAPLFLLLGRIFSLLSFGNGETVGFWVNLLSVVSSACTAMFTCWITTAFCHKRLQTQDWSEQTKIYTTLGAGMIAGLSCTFADSIWFNAVEAEVYAMSGFFTAIVVWLMMKWEARADSPNHLRWLILIAYMMGLSIGVHLLNLLTIPCLALIYYFRKYPPTWQGIALTLGISIAILGFIQYGIIQYTFSIAQGFELYFTGSETRLGEPRGGMGFPMGTGTAVLAAIMGVVAMGLLWWSHRARKVWLNISILAYMVVMLGFSSYTVIFIRSGANPAIDMNNPENIMTFLSYMRREQYGDRPLFRGPMYHTLPKINERESRYETEPVGMRYTLWDGKEKYIEDEMREEPVYESSDLVFFPRMYSSEMRHYADRDFGYMNFVSAKGNIKTPKDDKPTRIEDLGFFFKYQFVHMYMRYFMWNFVGRMCDEQDYGWEDGIIIRSPEWADNKGNNHYYFLPLILGIMGLLWQFSHSKRDTAIISLLFFFTGLAIILYLNQTPQQPRERDYAYASSFQTFCIWIGMGVPFLVELFYVKWKEKAVWLAAALSFLVPTLMCAQNWNDHSRRGRWIDVDFAFNLLNSCAKNAILFTAGDNDTFPLWYAQEVENIRPDVRVVNLELLISDWYIEQMQRKINESEPLPIHMNKNDYAGEAFNFYPYAPTVLSFPIQKNALIQQGLFKESEIAQIADTMVWNIAAEQGAIYRKDSVLINIIRNVAQNNWNRPVYFSTTVPTDSYLGLDSFLRTEGLALRVVPIQPSMNAPRDAFGDGIVHQTLMFENLKNFRYRGLTDASINFDDHIRNVIVSNYRNTFLRLCTGYSEQIVVWTKQLDWAKKGAADTLAAMGTTAPIVLAQNPEKIQQAQKTLAEIDAFVHKNIPYDVIRPNLNFLMMNAQAFYRADHSELAAKEFNELEKECIRKLTYYHQHRIPVDTRHPAYQGIGYAAQFYYESGNKPKAMELATTLEKLTGDGQLKQMLQNMDK